MKYDVEQETELRRYLLGEMTLEEQVLVEQRLFLDSDYAEFEQAVEADLIDDYLHGDLSGSERDAFERHFLLQPEHGENLKIAQALKTHLDSGIIVSAEPRLVPPQTELASPQTGVRSVESSVLAQEEADLVSPKPSIVLSPDPQVIPFFRKPVFWWSLAAAALIILSFLTWMGLRSLRGPAANEPLQANDPRTPQPAPTQPDERPQPSPSVPNNRNSVEMAQNTNTPEKAPQRRERKSTSLRTMTAALLPNSTFRGPSTGPKTVTIPADIEAVIFKLRLRFTEPYERYDAELLSGERRIDRWSNLTSQNDEIDGAHVSVTVKSDLLREQNYRIKLRGIPTEQQAAETEIYSFNIERK